ncbi:hypothetical protein OG21DRAFT_1514289, partial [Imleria badia]
MMLLLEHSVLYFVLNFAYEAFALGTLLPSSSASEFPYDELHGKISSMKGYRATSGALYIGSEGYPRSHGRSKSSSVPVTERKISSMSILY